MSPCCYIVTVHHNLFKYFFRIFSSSDLGHFAVKLPELLAFVNMEEDALNKLQQKLLDILKYAIFTFIYNSNVLFLPN
jgi:hypothetical protein